MHVQTKLAMLLSTVAVVAACERKPETPTTPPATAQRVAEHLREAGRELKAAATEAATEVKPALDRAAEEAREATHRLGERIENATSQPAPSPITQP